MKMFVMVAALGLGLLFAGAADPVRADSGELFPEAGRNAETSAKSKAGLSTAQSPAPVSATGAGMQLLPYVSKGATPALSPEQQRLFDSISPTDPDQNLADQAVSAYARLARLQVQAGLGKDAQKSLNKAREAMALCRKKSPQRLEQFNEAAAWCERANAAAVLRPKLETTLKTSPADPFANTTLATLELSLHGNLEAAAQFAAKSNRKDLVAFADVLKSTSSASQGGSVDPARLLALVDALVEIARATSNSQTFDRYAIASYAGDHLALALDDLPEEKKFKARLLLASAREIVERTGIRRGSDLPQWLASTKPASPAETPEVKTQTPVFLGEWTVVTSSGWRGNMTFNADGTMTEDANHGRHWSLTGGKLVVEGANSRDTFDVITKDKMTGINSHNRTTTATRAR